MLRMKKKKNEEIKMKHYAPDITAVPVEYIYPSGAVRLAEAQREITKLLSEINPDKYNSGYFDDIAKKKESVILQEVALQCVQHQNTIFLETSKHKAELARLKAEEAALFAELERYEAEILKLRGEKHEIQR